MNIQVPGYLYPVILAGTVVNVAAVLYGLKHSLKLAKWSDSDRQAGFNSIAMLLVGWAAAAIGLSWLGVFQGAATRVPTVQFGLGLPIIAGLVLYWRWGTLRRAVDAVPQSWLVGVQLYRTLGATFLILLAQGRLPGAFAWPAGAGDVLVGLLAPFAAVAYARRSSRAAGRVLAWNLLGIADLVVAVTTGFLTSPSPLQMLAFDQPNRLVTAFPLVLIPVFLVPLSILLHLASLKKLQKSEAGQGVSHAVLA